MTMRNFKKFISAVAAAAMTVTMAASGMAGALSAVNAAADRSNGYGRSSYIAVHRLWTHLSKIIHTIIT